MTMTERYEAMLRLLSAGDFNRSFIVQATRWRVNTVDNVLSDLVLSGEVIRLRRGVYGLPNDVKARVTKRLTAEKLAVSSQTS